VTGQTPVSDAAQFPINNMSLAKIDTLMFITAVSVHAV
jgi:hypothetical protein